MDRNPSFRPPLASGLFGLPPGPPEHPVKSGGLVLDIVNRSPRTLAYRCYSGSRPDQFPLFTGEVAPHGTVRIERLGSESSPMLHSLLIEAQPALHTGARAALPMSLVLLAVIFFSAVAQAEPAAPNAAARPADATAAVRTEVRPARPAPRLERRRASWPVAMRCPRAAISAKTRICGGIALV